MTMRFLCCLLMATLGLAWSSADVHAVGKNKKLNILYIMSDDHAPTAISCYGSWLKDAFKTPHLDKLAKEGMRFTNCVVVNSICTPSRGAILTGQYSHKNGVYTLSDSIDTKIEHLAHFLQRAGYQTALIGKWHLGTDPQGFDYWNMLVSKNGRPGQGVYYNPLMRAKGEKNKVHKGYSTDVIGGIAIDWMKNRDKNKPFFLMCHFKAPHRPWDPAPRYKDLFKGKKIPEPETLLDDYKTRSKSAANAKLKVGESMNQRDVGVPIPKDLNSNELRRWAYQYYMKRYLACCKAVDDNVGRLTAYLEEAGLDDNTLVIYSSDQGFFLGEHGYYDKRFMYEPCMLQPLIVRYPGHIQPNTVNNDMVLNIDFAPTMLEYAGVDIPKSVQGKSIKPLLEGKTPPDWRKSMYYRYYMHLAHHWVPAHFGVRTNRYTLIRFYGLPHVTDGKKEIFMKGSVKKPTEPEWELFDRQKDPEQVRNVYNDPEYADIVRELKAELRRLKKQVGDPHGPDF